MSQVWRISTLEVEVTAEGFHLTSASEAKRILLFVWLHRNKEIPTHSLELADVNSFVRAALKIILDF